MNEQEKRKYLEGYNQAKKKGKPFFPDIIFKDAVVSLLVFLVLVGLAYFLGAPLEERANPADTSYTPRPEWYFLFLFQLLKRFPGNLEVIGVFILPTLAILVLIMLPFLDSSARRHPLGRPVVIGVTSLVVVGIAFLTVQAVRETPPPSTVATGDPTAELYSQNCAPCHGASISVAPGTNLHAIIAQGEHEQGMPAWNGDLTTDQIDALAGFILSPEGNKLFQDQCAQCHETSELVATDPIELKKALEDGPAYEPHSGVEVPDWSQTMSREERTALLNFLVAPDGQRLFTINCAPCHGRSVPFSGEPDQLRAIISKGGLHLEMPPWREKLSNDQLDTLARYVVDPSAVPQGAAMFGQYCSSCHQRVPTANTIPEARQIIATGGPHQTMPVWGNVLTPEQLDALVTYTLSAARGTSLQVGQELFSTNCSPCHGEFGEGGPNPTRPDDIIAPISSAEFLKTRDDFTLKSIIAQGQPNFGMSPFGNAYGGPLEDEEIDAIVAYIRSWEQNPPVEVPPEVRTSTAALTGAEIYKDVCAQCHGPEGEGLVGPALRDPQFQAKYSDQEIFDTINLGHEATAMIGWGEILTQEQIQELVKFIRQLKPPETQPTPGAAQATATPTVGTAPEKATPTAATSATPGGPTPTLAATTPAAVSPSFANDVLPIFQESCAMCHGTFGGWDASSYESVMTTGDNAPVVVPGDPENSLLAQKILGTQAEGSLMPPSGKLPEDEIQVILDWISAGAEDN
jgi:mono/diheme cytochrome c family protein